jgi:hypothetical protein
MYITMILCPVPTGVHAYIEDVVVDEAYRRQLTSVSGKIRSPDNFIAL